MSPATRHIQRWALALAAFVALASCGGSGDGDLEASLPQNITFISPPAQTFGTPTPPLVATSTSTLPVSFSSGTPGVCTVSGTAFTLTGLGTCTITADQPGNTLFAPATPVARSFTVAGGQQTITFVSPGKQTLGTPPAPLMATSTSGLVVSFASTTPAVCTTSGTTLSLLSAGTCTVNASQPGTANYFAAPVVSQSFQVEVVLLAQTIDYPQQGNQTLGTPAPALVATASSGLAVTFTSMTPGVCTVSGTALTLVSAGTCTTVASQAGNATYAAAQAVSRSVMVSAAAQIITFAGPGNQTLGTPPVALSATATSGLPVAFASTTPAVCTVSGSTLTLVAVGTCTLNANQAGNATYAAAPTVTRNVNVSAAALTAQTINFPSPGNQTLGTAPAPLAATATSGLPVSFASTTASVCTVSGSTLTLVAAGSCIIDASQAGNATYAAAPTVSRAITVAAAALTAQTITFTSPGNQTLGTPPVPLVATASSGLPVSFASTTPSTCTVSGSTLTLVAAGSCIVDASQAGNATYAAAPTVSRVITVTAAALTAQTITFTSPGNQTLGTPPAPLVATASSGLPVSFASTTPSTCTVSGSTLTLVAVGTCIIDAKQAGNATYAAAPTVSRVVTIAAAPLTAQTITFTSPGNQTLGTPPAPLVATASSGLPVSFASTTPSTCTVSGSTLTLVAAGTCIIDASQAGNATYAAAPTVSRVVTIAAAPLTAQTITFTSPGNQTLGTPPAPLVATASSGLPVSFASTTPSTCTVSGSTLTLVAAGTCIIDASQAGNATYAAAAKVTQSVTVAVATQTITFAGPGNQTLGTMPAPLAATASSGLAVSFASTTPAVCTVSGNTLTLVAVGTCSLDASQPGNATYAPAPTVTRSVSVLAAPLLAQTITFAGPGNQTMGTPAPALSATATSGLAVSFASTTPAVCTVAGTTLTLVGAGNCSIEASQIGNATYAAAPTVTRNVTVATASQTITFAGPGNQTLGTPPPALSATATSGLVVSFSSTTPATCTVSGTTLTLMAVGTCTLNANQAGNATYAAAATVTRNVTVSAAPLLPQTISFPSPGNQTMGAAPPPLSATATSGLAVSFTSTTPATCTVSGTALTLVGAGTCTLNANQAGNAAYSAAPTVTRSVTVFTASQTITFAGPGDQTLGTAPPALFATASSGLVVSFTSATAAVCTVSGTTLTLVTAGTCTVNANQAGDATYSAAPTVTVSFTVAAAVVELFANGDFETAGGATPANAWLAAASGYTRSNESRSGSFSAQLSSPANNSAVMLQNSVEQGGRPPLTVGTSPTLSFWAKGTAGATGNVLFALRYLDNVGNIKANSLNQFFQGQINTTTWTLITYNLGVVPAGATAAFIEFSQGIGPIGIGPAGENWFAGRVLIDDLSLK